MVFVLVTISCLKSFSLTFEQSYIMIKKNFLVLVFNAFYVVIFSQQMPIDFNNSSHSFTVFGEVASANPPEKFDIFTNPENGADKVGRFFVTGNNPEPWQGFFIDLSKPINLDENKIITLNFFKYDGDGHSIILKFEQGSNPDVEVSVSIPGGANTAQQWTNGIEFDFKNAKRTSDNSTINATGSYNRLTIFIDGGIANKPPGTFLFDDINDGTVVSNADGVDIVYTDLVWSDEFDNNGTVDNSKWFHQTFAPNGGRWFNDELQHYTNNIKNSSVSDGKLSITAIREKIIQNNVALDFSSARLNSKFAFTYGRVDVKAKLPEGNGTWPAIWTLGKNINEPGAYWQTQGFGTTPWPACGELDVMEHGLHAVNEVSSAIHTPSSSGNTVNTARKFLSDVANNYHVYSMNWSPTQITFLIDGVAYYTYKPNELNAATWPFNLEQYLILNVAMGGFSGVPDANFTQSSMEIDYVRIYQNTNTASVDESFSAKFKIYPNPSKGFFKIDTSEKIDNLELLNTIGQRVLLKRSNMDKIINTENLPDGLYLLKINSGNKTVSKKIILRK